MSIQVGNYVRVSNNKLSSFGKKGLVTRIENNLYLVVFADNNKINVSNGGIALLNPECDGPECHTINYKDTAYMVTPNHTIVSLKSNRIMQWSKTNGDYKAIIELYEQAVNSDNAY